MLKPDRGTGKFAATWLAIAITFAVSPGFFRDSLPGSLPVGMALAQEQDLPAGDGAEALRAKCLLCHGADLITQQHLTRSGWVREVEKMIRWGAAANETEKEPLVAYLTAHYGPRLPLGSQVVASTQDRGFGILKTQCVLCHEADLIEQQRLSRAGWIREVDKMMRWGAVMGDTEKDALVDYVSGHFGSHRTPGRQ